MSIKDLKIFLLLFNNFLVGILTCGFVPKLWGPVSGADAYKLLEGNSDLWICVAFSFSRSWWYLNY